MAKASRFERWCTGLFLAVCALALLNLLRPHVTSLLEDPSARRARERAAWRQDIQEQIAAREQARKFMAEQQRFITKVIAQQQAAMARRRGGRMAKVTARGKEIPTLSRHVDTALRGGISGPVSVVSGE